MGFLGKIRIRTYFHGSNMSFMWFGRRGIRRGRKGELGGSFYRILVQNFCYEMTL
jgi:hypothetical protein